MMNNIEIETDDYQPLIGSTLPEWEFNAFHKGKFSKINLKKYRGKWLILFFYPADFTFVCPTELEDMAEHYDEFKKINAEVLSFSTDTHYVHMAWHQQSPAVNKIKFPMVSDACAKLSSYLGIYLEDEGVALRGTFIIDPNGVIKSIEVNDNSIGRNATELIRKLQAAIYVHEHKGEVCPAKWKPGAKTLKPGEKLIGKI